MNSKNEILETYSAASQEGITELYKVLTVNIEGKEFDVEHLNNNKLTTVQLRKHRIGVVNQYLLLGYNLTEIQHLVNSGGPDGTDEQQYWDISYSTLKRYKKHAMTLVLETPMEDPKVVYAKARARWQILMNKAVRANDLTNAREAAKQLDKIDGLESINLNVKVKSDLSGKTDEELLAIINNQNTTKSDGDKGK